MNRKKIMLILLGLACLAILLVCGHFGLKVMRRIRMRRTAMAAYENREYASAERLLLQYVRKDPEAEAEFVALANIYHEFGNTGMEAQMWQTVGTLDPRNEEYREKMLARAIESASYAILHGILGRKARVDEPFTDRELYLFVISSYRSGYPKDGADAYRKYVDADPEAFHKSELGRMAEFMATYETLSDGELDAFLYRAMHSEDPVIRFEAIYVAIRRMAQRDAGDAENGAEMEMLLKQAMEVNYFAGTPLLADYFFSKSRFDDAIAILVPYLKTIDDIDLYLLYAESCAFTCRLDKLRELEKKLRNKPGSMPLLADYCEILAAYLENDEKKLSTAVRKSGKLVDSPLSRFIRLRVAMANGSFNEIRSVAQEIFSQPPFHDLHNRALFICLNYIAEEMKKPENRKDPSQPADLAKILSWYLHGNRLLTEIILVDQYKKGLAREEDLMAALGQFPDDELLTRVAAEFLVFSGKAEEALPIIVRLLEDEKAAGRQPDRGIRLLHLMALDLTGRQDEAAAVFRDLLERSGFEADLLNWYFRFCLRNSREEDLASMAGKLDAEKGGKTEQYAKFFRAAALLLSEDGANVKEALDLLASAPDVDPDFTFYAANRLCEHDRFDEAEAKYEAISKTYRTPSLVYANLSIVHRAKGEEKAALEAAKTAFSMEKESMLPAFVYAERLAEAGRYEEAVDVLRFPRHAVDYREDIVELWCDCMRHVIETSIAERKFLQAESQCKHLLIVMPDDEFGKENLEKVRDILFPKKDKPEDDADEAAAYLNPPPRNGSRR